MVILGKKFPNTAEGYEQAAEHLYEAGFYDDARDFRAFARDMRDQEQTKAFSAIVMIIVSGVLLLISLYRAFPLQ